MGISVFSLTFNEQINYSDNEQGINFDVVLSTNDNNFVSVTVKLDTGSTFCIFQRKYAEALGLEVEKGTQEFIRTAKGNFTAYGHTINTINMNFYNMEWTAAIYFAQDESFPVNVVGRAGFLNFIKIGLVDYEQLLYVTPYNE